MTVYKVMAARTDRETALIQFGQKVAKERITKLWEQEMACKCEDAMNHLAALIKGEK